MSERVAKHPVMEALSHAATSQRPRACLIHHADRVATTALTGVRRL